MNRGTRHMRSNLARVMLASMALVVGSGVFQTPADAAATPQGDKVGNAQPAPRSTG